MEENVLDGGVENISENSLRSWRCPVAFGFVRRTLEEDVMKDLGPYIQEPCSAATCT